ncbi:MAG: hypothetical protein Q4G63_10665 [Bacteroidia bacterium]|nr:hypothetical protein [Bacteroidia bacterium]
MKVKTVLSFLTMIIIVACNTLENAHIIHSSPCLTSDGGWIIYVHSYNRGSSATPGIYKISIDGKNNKLLLETQNQVSLSPDDKQALLIDGIYLVEKERLTLHRKAANYGLNTPSWAEKGSRIIYELGGDIFITDTLFKDTKKLPIKGYTPKFIDNDKKIIYYNSIKKGLCITDTLSFTETMLTNNELDKLPVSSRNGKYIVWERNGEVWLMNSDGSNQNFLDKGRNPVWTPDSKHIVYSKSDNKEIESFFLWKMDASDLNKYQITK